MSDTIFHIYDKTFKKVLTLSSVAVINMINGLFDTDYPTDSTITYNWTEFEDEELRKVLADTILTINGRYSYHIEAQMTKDDNIIFRMFDYGYRHAERNKSLQEDSYTLYFPEPKIIYFSTNGTIPDDYTVKLHFGSQGEFPFHVPVFNYLKTTPAELTQKKLVILIPFELLKLQKIMKKERSPENLEALKNLIQNDILGSINENLCAGNITVDDSRLLRCYTQKLYDHIYSHYEEMEELNEMTDESFMVDYEIFMKERDEALAKKDAVLAEMNAALAEKDAEIERLKRQLADSSNQI
jgi:hypothetical protein